MKITESLQTNIENEHNVDNHLTDKNLNNIIGSKNDLRFAGDDFFLKLEEILVKVIGPVAVYVIDDVLWELNETRDKLLVSKIPTLAESISRQISDDAKRVNFLKEILQVIKFYEIS